MSSDPQPVRRGGKEVDGARPVGRAQHRSDSDRTLSEARDDAGRGSRDRDHSVFVGEDVTVEELMASGGFQRHRRAVVRCDDGQVGILSATAIERAVRARRMLADQEAAGVPGSKPGGVSGRAP